jgi:hypothetical protein
VISAPKGADGKYIEHSGAGVGALTEHVKRVEERMEMLGMQPLMARQADVTATAQIKDDGKVTSSVQAWIRRLERTLRSLYVVSATWVGEEESLADDGPEAVGFDVFNEFGLKVAGRDDSDLLLRTWLAGGISDESFLNELKKRGVLGEEVSVQDELERLRMQPGRGVTEGEEGEGDGST